jgi:ABC-2 type transport system ATP-binding protein
MLDPTRELPEAVIEIQGLTRQFGAKKALDNISLSIPRGIVFGVVGANGAGKTTLIKHLLGLLKAQVGSVRVFGLDPVKEPVKVLSRVGYLSEVSDLPGWMRVDELVRYMRAFYPTWDDVYAHELQKQFELDMSAKIKNLSKGQRARAGLLVALAYKPELLLLDEPSSGLDPIVRRDILGAIVRTIADEGRTVLFSSHLLDEVERISDRVAMLKCGRIRFMGELEDVRESHHQITLRFEEKRASAPEMEGVLSCTGKGREWTIIATGDAQELTLAASSIGGEVIEQRALTLDEIFLAHVQSASPMAAPNAGAVK